MLRRLGIVGQAVVALALGTSVLVVCGSWLGFRFAAGQARDGILRDIARDGEMRRAQASATFAAVANDLTDARRLLLRRAAADAPPPPLEARLDGTRRLLPGPGQPPLAAFIGAGGRPSPDGMRAMAAAVPLLAELGPTWCRDFPAFSIASPERWLVGYGNPLAGLVPELLPGDGVLLPVERDLLAAPGGDVRWSGLYLEPATVTWTLTALLPAQIGTARVAIAHPVPVSEVLRRLTADGERGAPTAVLDARGRAIACSDTPLPAETAQEAVVALPPGLTQAIAGLPADGQERVLSAASGDGWVAIGRLDGPGWTVATWHPATEVEGAARASAAVVLVVGAALLLGQSAIIVLILRQRIARPLRELREDVARMASGDREVRELRQRADEVGELTRAFAAMAASVARSEAGLREREALYRGLFDAAADAVLLLRHGAVVEANPRACSLLGVGALGGVALAGLAPERQPDGQRSTELLAHRLDAAEPASFPWLVRRPDGREVATEASVGRVGEAAQGLRIVALRDVTERNLLEEQVRQVQKMETVGQLAGGVAHDFNNMLAGIMGSAELLSNHMREDDRGRVLVERILQSGDRAATLVRRLLAFARKGRPVSSPVDVHAIIGDTIALLERSIDPRIRIRTDLAAEQVHVVGDAAMLQNALLNLAVNARDAMADGGTIAFSTRLVEVDPDEGVRHAPALSPGSYIEIAVADTGSGIPPQVMRRLFEPFLTTKAPGQGTGLGLASVQRTVHDHRGAVTAETAVGSGSVFRILLPLSDASRITRAVTAMPTGGSGCILVIDDESLVRCIAVEMLRTLGYEPIEAADGAAGVEAFTRERQRIRAVLVDMEMPGMRGIDCLRRMRAIDPGVRAILCSGFARDSGDEQLRTEGFAGFLGKPYRLYDLSRVVAEAIKGARNGA